MKEWLTAGDIAKKQLPGLPKDAKGVRRFMDKEKIENNPRLCRERKGKGGGREFHYTAMPPEAVMEYDALENEFASEEAIGRTKAIFTAEKHHVRTFIEMSRYRSPGIKSDEIHALYDKAFGKPGSEIKVPRKAEFTKYFNDIIARSHSVEHKAYWWIANDLSQYNKPYLAHLVVSSAIARYELLADIGQIELDDEERTMRSIRELKTKAARQWEGVPSNLREVFESERPQGEAVDDFSEYLYERLTTRKLKEELNREREKSHKIAQMIKKNTKSIGAKSAADLRRRLQAIVDVVENTRW